MKIRDQPVSKSFDLNMKTRYPCEKDFLKTSKNPNEKFVMIEQT